MQMTTEEKLEKALDFIRYIEKLPTLTASDILSSSAFCEDCGTACTVRVSDSFTKYAKVEDLQDKAWHLLADLTF